MFDVMNDKKRCAWCLSDPLYIKYHDEEWGKAVYDRDKLFEMLSLEGAQAGLSWITILKKREGYRSAFHHFNPEKISSFSDKDVDRLLKNKEIVRHRGKIESVINNAKIILEMEAQRKPFQDFVWAYVNNKTIDHKPGALSDLNSSTEISKRMSKDLKKLGFRFVGPTTCYSFMQAAGLVNDHVKSCSFR
jgi:DNA-3-methyladenine glycosylase I